MILNIVIIAIGVARKKLEVPGAKEFLGKGVSYCATCDGNFFKGRNVAVVGSDNEAAEEALHLADLAEKVTLVPHKELDIVDAVMKRLKSKKNVEILPVSKINAIVGDELVTGLKLSENGADKVLPLEGVFIAMGGMVVGGSALFAAILSIRKNKFSLLASITSGLIIMFFEFVEMLIIGSPAGPARFMQIFYFGMGTVIVSTSLGRWFLDLVSDKS